MVKITFSTVYRSLPLHYARITAAGVLPLLLLSSCALWRNKNVEPPPTKDFQVIERKAERIAQLERENQQLSDKLLEQKNLSQKLQTALLMRHKETDACLRTKEKLVAELSQSKAKLVNRGSKLEANTIIAEATAVISSVEEQDLNDQQKILYERATQNLEEGKRQLEKGYNKNAAYLSREAVEQARRLKRSGADTGSTLSAEEEIAFSTPLQMKLFITGNLRSGPSMKADIKEVIREGSRVTAIGFKRNWVKVKLSDPPETGWIHLSLLY